MATLEAAAHAPDEESEPSDAMGPSIDIDVDDLEALRAELSQAQVERDTLQKALEKAREDRRASENEQVCMMVHLRGQITTLKRQSQKDTAYIRQIQDQKREEEQRRENLLALEKAISQSECQSLGTQVFRRLICKDSLPTQSSCWNAVRALRRVISFFCRLDLTILKVSPAVKSFWARDMTNVTLLDILEDTASRALLRQCLDPALPQNHSGFWMREQTGFDLRCDRGVMDCVMQVVRLPAEPGYNLRAALLIVVVPKASTLATVPLRSSNSARPEFGNLRNRTMSPQSTLESIADSVIFPDDSASQLG
eukprot:TRINITY_DN25913_c0_g2_i1.p1 TRINITY_DN25913_c0_g2~~TRINITY_DN25913_c0_g2_i1.p1  ORF type:complete len:310 (-),score=54.23 TRINITY_DN25913_c0_g2_i1:58-987(-)